MAVEDDRDTTSLAIIPFFFRAATDADVCLFFMQGSLLGSLIVFCLPSPTLDSNGDAGPSAKVGGRGRLISLTLHEFWHHTHILYKPYIVSKHIIIGGTERT